MSKETTPLWAKKLIKEVSDLNKVVSSQTKDLEEVKKQTLVNCGKLNKLDIKLSTVNAQLGGVNGRLNSVETHLVRQDKILTKINNKL